MAWIETVDEEKATAGLLGCYSMAAKSGPVDNIIRVQSLDPAALASHLGIYKAVVLNPGALSRARREMLGTVVSAANRCHY